MEIIGTIIQLVKPGVFMSKLDTKDAYYIMLIYEPDQKYLKFQFRGFLYKYTALPNCYTEGPRKFTTLLKPPLSRLRKVEKIVIAGCFHVLIFINSSHISCLRNVAKVTKSFIALGFVIHPSKSQFIPTQKIEYLGFMIDSVSISVFLSNKKKKAILDICENTLITSKVTIRHIARVLGKFSSSFLAVPLGRLH